MQAEFSLTAAFALVAAISLVCTGEPPSPTRQTVPLSWTWNEESSELMSSVERLGKPYHAVVESDVNDPHSLNISILRDAEVRYKWEGNRYSVFLIERKTLYFAVLSPIATGCQVVAVDLDNNRELWRTPLQGLGLIRHSKYRNRVNICASESDVIICGHESAGDYLETISKSTGKQVNLKIVMKEPRDATPTSQPASE